VSAFYNERIKAHVAYAYANAPGIRRLMDKAGVRPDDVQTAADLARLPVIAKDHVPSMQQEDPPFGGLLAVPVAQLGNIFISPGPIYEPRRDNSGLSGALKFINAAGMGAGDIILNTFLYHYTPAGMLMDEALRAVGCTVVPTGPGETDRQVFIAMRLGATGYVGTPSFFAHICDKAKQFGIDPKLLPIKKAIFSAEIYTDSLRARFDEEYGMTTISAYGTAELGIIGYELPKTRGFRVVDNMYVEIVDPQSGQLVPHGEIGEVVVTLFDKHYPLTRFGTGDLGALDPDAPADQPIISGLYGRSGEAVKVRGMFLHPNQIEATVTSVPQVKYAQAIVTRPDNRDHLLVRVQLKAEHADADAETVQGAVKEHLQREARLKVDGVEIVAQGVIDPAQRAIKDERKWD
jgi:phenylacetate-CoA ligase